MTIYVSYQCDECRYEETDAGMELPEGWESSLYGTHYCPACVATIRAVAPPAEPTTTEGGGE